MGVADLEVNSILISLLLEKVFEKTYVTRDSYPKYEKIIKKTHL